MELIREKTYMNISVVELDKMVEIYLLLLLMVVLVVVDQLVVDHLVVDLVQVERHMKEDILKHKVKLIFISFINLNIIAKSYKTSCCVSVA